MLCTYGLSVFCLEEVPIRLAYLLMRVVLLHEGLFFSKHTIYQSLLALAGCLYRHLRFVFCLSVSLLSATQKAMDDCAHRRHPVHREWNEKTVFLYNIFGNTARKTGTAG